MPLGREKTIDCMVFQFLFGEPQLDKANQVRMQNALMPSTLKSWLQGEGWYSEALASDTSCRFTSSTSSCSSATTRTLTYTHLTLPTILRV
jgi:hypothetical protein